jgi:negative regulator of sigma E activity
MTRKLTIAGVFVLTILALVLTFDGKSQAQAAPQAPVTYIYKVEPLKANHQQIEKVLNADAKDGWRLVTYSGGDYDRLFFVLEKPAP